jgi:tRNA(Ile)-lysidine synthase
LQLDDVVFISMGNLGVCVKGMECQVLKCNWVEGVPTSGHLQEAARNARYNLMEQACRRHSIRILLMAHHADDQAELFMMRMARGSGVIGLAAHK